MKEKLIKEIKKLKMFMVIVLIVIIVISISCVFMNDNIEIITKIGENDKNAMYDSSTGFSYELNSDETGIVITGWGYDTSYGEEIYDGTNLNIPETINGYTVTEIKGFLWNTVRGVKNLKIPKTVMTVTCFAVTSNISGIESIIVDNNSEYLSSENGVLFNKDKTELIRYPDGKKDTTYTVPSTVKEIGKGAFRVCRNLLNIELLEELITIGDSAFFGCNFTSIKLPATLKNICTFAFASCDNLTSLEIPEGVTKIESYAFNRCKNLENIKLPSTLKQIDMLTFTECNSLTSINIPFGVETIKPGAFDEMKNLINIEIPASVKQISDMGIARKCNNLVSINVDPNNENYTSEDGVLFNKDKTVLMQYPDNKEGASYKIPDSVTTICYLAFYKCVNLRDIEMSKNVTSISSEAFNSTSINSEVYYENINNLTIHCYRNSEPHKYAERKPMNFLLIDEITKIEVTTVPTKLNYVQNSETLNLTGGVLTLTLKDGKTETLDMATETGEITEGITVTGFDNTTLGEKTVTVTYEGQTAEFQVNIIEKTVTKIEVTKNPTKTSYKQNKENLNLAGGEITETYNDNTTERVIMTDSNVTSSGFSNATLGEKEITITYKGKTAKINVEVIQDFEYEETEDGTGIIIKGTQEGPYIVIPDNIDGKPIVGIGEGAFKDREDIISVEIPNTVTDIASDAFEGTDEVTIITNSGTKGEEYAKENDMNYELLDKTIGSISVDRKPNKTVYTKEDTKIDITGGKILLTYTDGTTSKVSMKIQGMEVTGFDNTVIGKQNIKVKYKTKETTFEIQIKGKTILLGDINKDGKIDSTDLLLMKRHIIAQSKTEWILKGENFEAGDMNGDGNINATDLLLLKREIVKQNSK